MLAISVNMKVITQSKQSPPLGENSPNLVTLIRSLKKAKNWTQHGSVR
jgi:hypothetical protein